MLQTTQLLSNSAHGFDPLLAKEILESLLEHDRWKTLAKFEHEIELEKIRSNKTQNYKPRYNSEVRQENISEEELKYNVLTSYGACSEKHIGLIAKTKVWEGANKKSSEILERWIEYISNNHKVSEKDLKELRIKSLLLLFLWGSGCSYRMHIWPDAKDKEFVLSIKDELKTKFSKFSKTSIVSAYEGLKEFWKEINDNEEYPFNSSLFADILDEAYEYVNKKQQIEASSDVKNSPLFISFEEEFPHVPLEVLEKYYMKQRKNFIPAGVAAVRKVFTTQMPEEFEEEYSSSEWPKKWHQYVSLYEPRWRDKLNNILVNNLEEHKKWESNQA